MVKVTYDNPDAGDALDALDAARNRIRELERLCQWAADRLRHRGDQEATITAVISRLTAAK